MNGQPNSAEPTLARNIGLAGLVVYGVGDMVGAGIYGTTGVAAAKMGNAVWLGFVAAMIVAMLTGLSYASIASRYPRAAGAAYVVNRAFGVRYLSYLVGLAVVASGLTSMAAGSRFFAQVLAPMVGAPGGDSFAGWAVMMTVAVAFIAAVFAINFRGITESAVANLICTVLSVGGLFFVVAVGARFWGGVDYLETPPASGGLTLPLVLSGAVLTFFAFVGFEDLLNLSEEVKRPERTMPLGIVGALAIVTVIYVAVAITAVSVVPYADLGDASKGAPLAQIGAKAAPWLPMGVLTFLSLFAVFNTALMNSIMGSRLLYGMSRQGLLPALLGRVHARRRTPHVAIGLLFVIVAALAFAGDIGQLASATSLLLLSCFLVVNVALLVLQRRHDEPRGRFEIPAIVPVLGALACGGLIVTRVLNAATPADQRAPLIAGAILLGITILFFATRPRADVVDRALGE